MGSLVVGFLVAFALSALMGVRGIALLRRLGARQAVSSDAPTSHSAKQGTPTMGGTLILTALTVTTVAYLFTTQLGAHRHPGDDYTLAPLLLLTLGFGGIGFADDLLSARRGRNLGLRAREKFGAQCLLAAGFAAWLWASAQNGLTTWVAVSPTAAGIPPHTVDLGGWYYVLAAVYIVGLSNAANFADGLDGLAGGLSVIICIALTVLVGESVYPQIGFLCAALAGAVVGFLWWNAYPARVFMGDTGSLALGACLAGVGLVGKQEIGLAVASLVMWAELVSVMIQVSVFKLRRRRRGLEYARNHRVFRRTPLHHHFEELGWAETQVVTRFWIAGAACSALSLLWLRS